MASTARLVLASGSPRRRELLARVGVAFDIEAADIADIDESHQRGETPADRTNELQKSVGGGVAGRSSVFGGVLRTPFGKPQHTRGLGYRATDAAVPDGSPRVAIDREDLE